MFVFAVVALFMFLGEAERASCIPGSLIRPCAPVAAPPSWQTGAAQLVEAFGDVEAQRRAVLSPAVARCAIDRHGCVHD